ncbi:MAG: hypothetical protein CL528_00465 [Aequorivita sp.]|jgi:hypothetical protein|nr:hypothetical protein [Aequorivita sp.]MBP40223.1 hypothetical protein [Aequorivita sp.]|tara:strand:+ start:1309 stop:1665 length:357 start_codon:yes stop_codon:yes gene_type:complete
MKNLPHTPTKQLPAHYLDNRTQQMCNDAIADIQHHMRQSALTWDQTQVEKELNLFYKQLEALDKPAAAHLRIDEKKTLRKYYQNMIRQNTARLDVFINGLVLTARAINCNVVEPQILS